MKKFIIGVYAVLALFVFVAPAQASTAEDSQSGDSFLLSDILDSVKDALKGGIQMSSAPILAPMPTVQTVEEYVRSAFADAPIMIEIAKCESQFRQYDNKGDVLKNSSGSSATGVFQIIPRWHQKAIDQLDIDVNTLEGNVTLARYIYETQGTKPWEADKASVGCWSQTAAGKNHLASK